MKIMDTTIPAWAAMQEDAPFPRRARLSSAFHPSALWELAAEDVFHFQAPPMTDECTFFTYGKPFLNDAANTPAPASTEADRAACQLEEAITVFLRRMGVPPHIKGYAYLRRAIFLVVTDPSLVSAVTKILYPDLAQHYKTTSTCVERAIRYAIETAWDRCDEAFLRNYFGYTSSRKKPTNRAFIATVADLLRTERWGDLSSSANHPRQ